MAGCLVETENGTESCQGGLGRKKQGKIESKGDKTSWSGVNVFCWYNCQTEPRAS